MIAQHDSSTAAAVSLINMERLTRDLRVAAATLSDAEARYLVDLYYMVQEDRKSLGNRAKAMDRLRTGEPHVILDWFHENVDRLERDIERALSVYAESQRPARWAMSIHGIGPIIAAGLLAHIDIHKAPTVGHIWRFAGLDPTVVWGKGQKRPWNASLKVLAWKIGQSFQKVCYSDKDYYGHIYQERKEYEIGRNDRGELADQAAAKLAGHKIGHDTEAYKAYSQGSLPPAHLDARARRYAVKLFLAHYHHIAYECAFGKAPPLPYILTQPGHVHFILPPNWPMD
jgi:hypothetical protein